MNEFQRRLSGRQQRARNSSASKTKSIKLHQSLSDRMRSSKQAREIKKATYLATLPKNRFKRMLVRLQPKRMAQFWFSRQGAIAGLKVVGIGIVVVFLLTIGVFAYFRKDLPNIKDISGDNIGGSISYYDRTGTVLLWQDYNAVKRIPVPGNQISQYMKDATVAIEDKNFYHEGAFNFGSIIRATLNDVIHHGESNSLQGASTITEQVVKLNENWTGNRTITTKVKELILAVELSREYSKNDILTAYLNAAPYGGVEYGCEAAAEDYFHSNCDSLTLAQASFLAAIPQSPAIYSPYSSPQYNPEVTVNYFDQPATIGRQEYILNQMAQQGYITQAQADQAKTVNVLAEVQPLQNKYSDIQAPYFVLAAKQELENKYGAATVNRGGWKVTTTLNLQLQQDAQTDVANNLPNVERDLGDEEAVVMESVPTGQILAEVGGVNFSNPNYGQINYAQTNIPPGSSFKPYDYVSLINDNNNVGAGSVLYDVQEPLPGYPCTNRALLGSNGGNCLQDYDFKYPGAETLRYALAGSRNVPAAKAMISAVPNSQCEQNDLAGCVPSINKVISTADAMMDYPNAYQCYSDVQLTQTTQCYDSSAFGDGAYLHLDEHVNGDATLARLGQAIPNTYIYKITDSSGNLVYQWTQPKPTQPVRPDAAYILDNILSDPRASYLPGSCTTYTCTPLTSGGYKFQRYDGWDIAVKTGTTNDNFDGLMTSWSTQFAVDSWVGYHTRNVALTAGQMEYLTEPLTRTLQQQGLDSLHETPVNWTQPSDIKVLPAYVQRTHIDFGDEEPGPSTDLFPSWYVQPTTSSGTETVDKVSGGVATSCTPALAKEIVGGANASTYSVDLFYPIGQTGTSGSNSGTPDNVHKCGDTQPSVTITQGSCEDNAHCDFTITVTQGTYALSGGAYTTPPAGTIELIANGQTLTTQAIPTSSGGVYTVTLTDVPITNGETVEAQVVDSVLYSGTNTTQVVDTNANPPPTTSPISGP